MYRPRFPYVRSALHTVDRPMSRSNSLPTRATREKPGENFDPASPRASPRPRFDSPPVRITRASPRFHLAHLVSIISSLASLACAHPFYNSWRVGEAYGGGPNY